MDPEEQKIVERLRQGDNKAYKYVYDHHYVLLCKIAYGFLNDYHLAETVVNEMISHIYEIREGLQINSSLRSYLVSAVRNRCINFLNLEYRRKVTKFSAISDYENWGYLIADKEEYPLGTLLENELEQKIHEAIEKLSEKARRVFKMSRFEERTYKEIADELNISVNTVKYHIKSALAQLARYLDKYLLALLLMWMNL